MFATEPEFEWFTNDGSRSRKEGYDRSTLRRHLQSVAAGTDEVGLQDFQFNGTSSGNGNFQYVLNRTATDGTTTEVLGKGAIRCSSGQLIVWSQA